MNNTICILVSISSIIIVILLLVSGFMDLRLKKKIVHLLKEYYKEHENEIGKRTT